MIFNHGDVCIFPPFLQRPEESGGGDSIVVGKLQRSRKVGEPDPKPGMFASVAFVVSDLTLSQ